MITIISGTNRSPSNTILIAEYYKKILDKRGTDSQILDLAQLPPDFLFTALYENARKDPSFNQFIDTINASEKFVFIVPEYNGSFPGVLKSFIDGLDFPGSFKDKKGALVGISSGAMAGTLALSHLTDILNYMGMHILAVKPRIPRIHHLFKEGKIADTFLDSLLETQADSLINF